VRLQHLPGYAGTIADGDWTGVVRCLPERLDQPLRWKRPRRIFVDSMSDLFHPDVPDAYIQAVIEVMAYAKQHTFQVLTKRPQRMAALLGYWHDRGWLLGKGAPGVGTLRPEVNHPTAKAGGLREGPSSPG
jgi:protein gp37